MALSLCRKKAAISPRKLKRPWFREECKQKRKKYLKAKQKFRKLNHPVYLLQLKTACKEYKKQLYISKRKHHLQFCHELRNMKTKKPREYWSKINQDNISRQNEIDIPCETLLTYFQNMNSVTSQMLNHQNSQSPYQTLPRGYNNEWNPDGINNPITSEEVKRSLKSLKQHKACGTDQIINEFLQATQNKMLSIYVNLFNCVLFSGTIPEDWTVGIINPIFKRKGDKMKPENYRGITVLSCLGKLFTSVLNNRIISYIERNNILGEEQAGFRPGYSTTDQIFTLKSIKDIYLYNHKKLFCAYIDYSAAYDKIKRPYLWEKLIKNGINGPILKTIFMLYNNAKSGLSMNGKVSEYFACSIGVRQGENMSPTLYALFVNDLKEYLQDKFKGLPFLTQLFKEILETDHENVFNMFLLMYADDTVILAETAQELQLALDAHNQYCKTWELTVNISKTKVMVFSRGKCNYSKLNFTFGENHLEIVDEYIYLGVKMSYNGKTGKLTNHLHNQGQKAMFGMLQRSRKLNIPLDLVSDLFDTLVTPVLLYGCEIYAPYKYESIENVNLRFCKYLLGVNASTKNVMAYGETGRKPLHIQVKTRTISFWNKLTTGKQSKLSVTIYSLLIKLFDKNQFKSDWIKFIINTLNECGLTFVWHQQHAINLEWLKSKTKQILNDQYSQEWDQEVHESPKCLNYRIFKTKIELESYLTVLPFKCRKSLAKFRTSTHNLPIEKGRHHGIPREKRICTLCNTNAIGDEYHYIMECTYLELERKKHLGQKKIIPANSETFRNIFINRKKVRGLSRFVSYIMCLFET